MGELASKTYGGGTPTTSNDEFWNGTIPWIQSSDLIEHQVFGVHPRKYITKEAVMNSATKIVPENALAIITRVGVGKLAVIPFSYTTSQDFLSLSELKTDVKFTAYLLYKKLQCELIFVQGTSIKGITKDELLSKIVFVPERKEQEAISAFFANLDNLITLHQRKLDKMKELKKAFLNLIFSQKLRFEGFTDSWELRKLEELVDVCSGRDYKHLSEGDIPVYGTGGYMLSVSEALSYDKDAIGIGRKGTIDKPYILNAPFWTVDTLFYAIPKEKVDLNFAFAIFQNINWKKKDESTGVPSLSRTAINEIHILVPKYDEQQALGQLFYDIDRLITLHQKKIDSLKEMKKILLKNMLI